LTSRRWYTSVCWWYHLIVQTHKWEDSWYLYELSWSPIGRPRQTKRRSRKITLTLIYIYIYIWQLCVCACARDCVHAWLHACVRVKYYLVNEELTVCIQIKANLNLIYERDHVSLLYNIFKVVTRHKSISKLLCINLSG